MRNFKELTIWQKSYALTLLVYEATSSFPKEEIFGLTSQIRRSSISVAANIAEGCGYESNLQFKRYLAMASGSASELDCHIRLSRDLGFISEPIYEKLQANITELRKMLFAFTKSVK